MINLLIDYRETIQWILKVKFCTQHDTAVQTSFYPLQFDFTRVQQPVTSFNRVYVLLIMSEHVEVAESAELHFISTDILNNMP